MKKNWSRLTKEEELLLALLNDDDDKTVKLMDSQSSLNYTRFFDLLTLHRVSPLIMAKLLKGSSNIPFPAEYLKIAKLDVLRNSAFRKLRLRELQKVVSLLNEHNFDITLLKGFSFDPEDLYLRYFTDIDLLINENKILDAISLLTQNGYKYKGSFVLSEKEKLDINGQLSWNNQYQFTSPGTQLTIEIHTNLFERDRIRYENLAELLDHPEIFKRNRAWNDRLNCFVPCTEACLLLLCLHSSLKRSLANDSFILRHITDMDILFSRGIDSSYFISLVQESQTTYHQAFALNLYERIKEKDRMALTELITALLSPKEVRLMNYHLSCTKNLYHSSRIRRLRYNITAPFIIVARGKKRLFWILSAFFNSKVQQEHRYMKYGVTKESPLIYLTYLFNPFQSTWQFFKKTGRMIGRSRQR